MGSGEPRAVAAEGNGDRRVGGPLHNRFIRLPSSLNTDLLPMFRCLRSGMLGRLLGRSERLFSSRQQRLALLDRFLSGNSCFLLSFEFRGELFGRRGSFGSRLLGSRRCGCSLLAKLPSGLQACLEVGLRGRRFRVALGMSCQLLGCLVACRLGFAQSFFLTFGLLPCFFAASGPGGQQRALSVTIALGDVVLLLRARIALPGLKHRSLVKLPERRRSVAAGHGERIARTAGGQGFNRGGGF